MSIRVVCPNGHALKVADNFAGKTGLCPVCKGQVKVPQPSTSEQFSEEAILGLLRPRSPVLANHDLSAQASGGVMVDPPAPPPPPAMKTCEHCHREVAAKVQVCPFCHTYIGVLSDV